MGLVIGVTGGIGSGKSEFVKYLGELGAKTMSADEIARCAIEPGTTGYTRIIEVFGRDILDIDGNIDRAKLAQIVFNSADALKQLNSIIHPEVIDQIKNQARIHRETAPSGSLLVLEIPLLFECGAQSFVDVTVVVTAEQEARLNRLTLTRHMSEEDALNRMSSQYPEEQKIGLADVIIYNNSTLEDLKHKSIEFFNHYACP